jgi:hypothetical protein
MSELDPKQVADGIHAATELAKTTRGLIKELGPLVKKIPWHTLARVSASLLRTILAGLKESVRFPEPLPRTTLAIKFLSTIGSYIAALFCLVLFAADAELIGEVHPTSIKLAKAVAFLIFTGWATVAALAQAEWLRFLLAQNSRLLWGHRPTSSH